MSSVGKKLVLSESVSMTNDSETEHQSSFIDEDSLHQDTEKYHSNEVKENFDPEFPLLQASSSESSLKSYDYGVVTDIIDQVQVLIHFSKVLFLI